MCYRKRAPVRLVYLLDKGMGVCGRNIKKHDRVVHMLGAGRCFTCQTFFTRKGFIATTSTFRPYAVYLVPVPTVVGLVGSGSRLTLFFVHRLSVSLKVSSREAMGLARGRVHKQLTRSLLFLGSACKMRRSRSALDVCLSQRSLTGLSGVAASGTVHALSGFTARGLVAVSNEGVGVVSRRGLGGVDGVKWGLVSVRASRARTSIFPWRAPIFFSACGAFFDADYCWEGWGRRAVDGNGL